MPEDKEVAVKDLTLKLDHLRTDKDAQAIGRHTGSQPSFAIAIGAKRRTLYDWLNGTVARQALPSDVNSALCARFGFAVDWPPWLTGDIAGFKEAFARHAQQLIQKASLPPAPENRTATAVAWNPPTTRAQVLKRLEGLKLEELAGEVGVGHIVLAHHPVEFVDAGDDGAPDAGIDLPNARTTPNVRPVPGKTSSKLKAGDLQFAGVAFTVPLRNTNAFPWPLGLDVALGALDDGLHIRQCRIECIFTGQATTVEQGRRKSFPGSPGSPALTILPEYAARKSKLQMLVSGPGNKQAGWGIAVPKGPIGSFTARDLVEVTHAVAGDTVEVMLIVPLKGLADSSED